MIQTAICEKIKDSENELQWYESTLSISCTLDFLSFENLNHDSVGIRK